jgi:predicted RNA binding protein YcfA (HicA-like mRNA interferase family)
MSKKLPIISGNKLIRVLNKLGYEIIRQKGSHVRLKDTSNPSHIPVTVPLHKEIKPGLLRKIMKDAHLTLELLIELLKE